LRHGLRRDIIGTVLGNEIVNRGGLTFVSELASATGKSPAEIAKAYAIARELLDLDAVWPALEALDNKLDAQRQLGLFAAVARALLAATRWLLRQTDRGIIEQSCKHYAPRLERLLPRLPRIDPQMQAEPEPGTSEDVL